MGVYGTNLEGFGAFEGGVNADKGAPLVSTSSDGETALLFGPAALREIQAGVANGDFAIPPDAAGDTITAENPLPYWTFTDTSSSGNITCAIVTDATAGSGNTLVWTVAANTSTGSAKITRYIPVAATQDRAFAYTFEVTAKADAATNRKITVSAQYVKQDLTNTGTSYTGIDKTFTEVGTSAVTLSLANTSLNQRTMVPADAAYLLIEISIAATASNALSRTLTVYEVRMPVGQPMLLLGERTAPATYGPASMWKTGGVLNLAANLPTTWTSGTLSTTEPTLKISETLATISNGGLRAEGGVAALASPDATTGTAFQVGISTDTQARLLVKGDGSLNFGPGSSTAQDTNLYRSAADTLKTDDSLVVVGSIGFDAQLFGSSALTGPSFQLAGTNEQLWTASSSDGAADLSASTTLTRSGVLITKPTAGQPSTNINGTANTDAFADALRNGGIAVDTTNNRAYFYSGGWKYAALTTPSDSRLKEEITEITGALDTLRQLVPVAFKWKRPEAHGRAEAVADDGKRLGFIADQVATTDLKHWVETLGVDEREADLVDTSEVLAVNIPQNEMEALVVQALLDIDARLKVLEDK